MLGGLGIRVRILLQEGEAVFQDAARGGRLDVAGVVWRTTNYGLNWAAQGISADEIFDVFIFDSLNAITLSGDPEVLYAIAKIKTTDAGFSWNHEDLLFYGLSFTIDFTMNIIISILILNFDASSSKVTCLLFI